MTSELLIPGWGVNMNTFPLWCVTDGLDNRIGVSKHNMNRHFVEARKRLSSEGRCERTQWGPLYCPYIVYVICERQLGVQKSEIPSFEISKTLNNLWLQSARGYIHLSKSRKTSRK